jgi:hypothetical protein
VSGFGGGPFGPGPFGHVTVRTMVSIAATAPRPTCEIDVSMGYSASIAATAPRPTAALEVEQAWTPYFLTGGTAYWLRPSLIDFGGDPVPSATLTIVSDHISAADVGHSKSLTQATAGKRLLLDSVDNLDRWTGYVGTQADATEFSSASGGVSGAGAHTIAVVMHHADNATYRGIVGFGTSGASSTIGVQTSHHWGGGNGFVFPDVAGDNNTHLLVVTYDGTTKTLFVDGERIGAHYASADAYNITDPRFGVLPAFTSQIGDATIYTAVWATYAMSHGPNGEVQQLSLYARESLGIVKNNYLLAVGDSQSSGFGTTVAPANWPTRVTALGGLDNPVDTLTEAVAGHTTDDVIADFGPYVVRFTKLRGICVATVWVGTNDLFFGASAAATWTKIQTICAALRAAGWYVILFTALPRTEPGETTPSNYAAQQPLLNALILGAVGAGVADDVYDVAALFPDSTDLGDYQAGGVHLNTAANDIIAGDITAKLNILSPGEI